jgi:glycosyltransferase involved in cell wall biosynthesis
MRRAKSGKQTSLSLCMIVKDEAACLGRCLESVRRHVDEIVIVDTGSTDRTVEIAAGFGARIFHHPWENDFSKHRNQSLSYATGEWIFQLDADEELFAEDGRRLRETIQQGEADYYHCRFHDIKKDGSVHGVFNLIRLFRAGMGMRFERKVHNQLQTQGKEGYSAIRIRHYGYDLAPRQMEAKHIRTTTLLREIIDSDPQDAYSLFQLAASYSMHREFDKAVTYGERALDIMRRDKLQNGYFLTAYHTVAQGYYALGRYADAERIGLEALDTFPLHLDMAHLLATLYFRTKTLDRCRLLSHRYLEIHSALTEDPSLVGTMYCHSLLKKHEILFGLALVHFTDRDIETADRYFEESLNHAQHPLETAVRICRFYLDRRADEKAMKWLRLVCEAGSTASKEDPSLTDPGLLAYDVTEMFCRHRHWELAQSALRLALDIAPDGFDRPRFDRLLKDADPRPETAQASRRFLD